VTSGPFAPVLYLLRGLVEERLGLHYGEGDLPMLGERVGARAHVAGMASLHDYYARLREDPDPGGPEWLALADHLAVGETYFFRETPPLEALIDAEILPRLQRGQPSLRLWSAGCATGEEPLTVAMLLAERRCLDRVVVHATDVSPAALARARTGRYPANSLRLPALPECARRFISRLPDGALEVAPELRAQIRWQTLNLLDTAGVRALGVFDVILCRNVIIYFSERATRQLVSALTEALNPGGVLAVGVSESLHRFSAAGCPPLSCEEHQGAFYYRKPRG
jgi:chemotaxis protein methyltransferase CheR